MERTSPGRLIANDCTNILLFTLRALTMATMAAHGRYITSVVTAIHAQRKDIAVFREL